MTSFSPTGTEAGAAKDPLISGQTSHLTTAPREVLDTKGDALGSSARASCDAGAAPCAWAANQRSQTLWTPCLCCSAEGPDHRSPS